VPGPPGTPPRRPAVGRLRRTRPVADGDAARVHVPDPACRAARPAAAGPGRRGRAGQPERRLGPAAARSAPRPGPAPGPAAGPGAVGADLALRVRVRDEDLLAALDDGPASGDRRLPARCGPRLRSARLLVGRLREPVGGAAVRAGGGTQQLAGAADGHRARRGHPDGADGIGTRGAAPPWPRHLRLSDPSVTVGGWFPPMPLSR